MKALSALCSTGGASVPPTIINGRVGNAGARHHRGRSDSENVEIQMYLSKLKDLVPFMPKNRKLSKLEVIEHVISYICDLQLALETHPMAGQNATPFEDYLNNNNSSSHHNPSEHKSEDASDSPSSAMNSVTTSSRQPLGVRPTSSNQIVEPHNHHHHTGAADLMFLQQHMANNNSNVSSPNMK